VNLQQCRNELKIMIKVLIISLFMTTLVGSKSVHNFKVHDLSGKEVQLNMYKGKVLLIVNTASECGFTPQYEDLEAVYQLYKNKGFEVLAFPSNDFGGQEPLNGNEIQQFCSVKFHTTFPIFDKIHVKGKNANPLYSFLSNKSQNGNVNIAPKWNFQKYLIDKNGYVIDYYLSTTSPTSAKVKKAIEALLAK
jgi:glutathione peroxidase